MFASVALDEACGALLAHSIKLPERRLKKGQVLDERTLAALAAAGIERVTVARLEASDVAEDEAAGKLAAGLAGDNIRVARALTGRCNLYAQSDGLLVIEAPVIEAVNQVHEALTVATLMSPTRVSAGQMLATIKVIPYAAPAPALARCLDILAHGGFAMTVHGFRHQQVAMLQTRVPGGREALLNKMRGAIEDRLLCLGSRLQIEERCAHEVSVIAASIEKLLGMDIDMLLIAGASAIVDRCDVIPAAIEAAGGHILHFGMPVDPGNLLLLARYRDIPVIGLPSCARSPSFNGLDHVLERFVAGLEVSPRQLMGLGVGGLLKEIRERPQAREALPNVAAGPRICAVLLAAGMSRRMGSVNKLLAPVQGQAMVCRVADQLLASRIDELIVVTGHQANALQEALGDRNLRYVHNPDFAHGLSRSLAAGLAALGPDCQAVLVCLADMPELDSVQINRLLEAYDPAVGALICVPTFAGKRGNPVLWDRLFFDEMQQIQGDVGARHLIGEHAQSLVEVAMPDRGVVFDVDSPQVLAQLGNATS